MLECEIYPIWNTGSKNKKTNVLKDYKKATHKIITKKVVRLVNGNFTNNDIWVTVGYTDENQPTNKEQAKKDVINYLRRLQRWLDKNNKQKLKYVYVTEISKTGRYHHHIVMSFPNRDVAEQKWGKGEYPQARRLKTNDYGLSGLAGYISKQLDDTGKGAKSYGYSLNLYKPWEKATVNDFKMSNRKNEKIARGEIDARAYFEKQYPNYTFLEVEILYSDFISGCYVYAKMKKKEVINKRKNC